METKKKELHNCPNCKFRIKKIIDSIDHIEGYRCSLQGNNYICKSTDNLEDVECNIGLFEKM